MTAPREPLTDPNDNDASWERHPNGTWVKWRLGPGGTRLTADIVEPGSWEAAALNALLEARAALAAAEPPYQSMWEMAEERIGELEAALAAAEQVNAEWEREATRIGRKLMDGTMHCLICNGDHNAKVGAPGLICNCPPGQEIKSLRHQLAAAAADTRRLDWLAASAAGRTEPLPIECWYLEGVYSATVIWATEYNFPTPQLALRAAIDAALDATKEGK